MEKFELVQLLKERNVSFRDWRKSDPEKGYFLVNADLRNVDLRDVDLSHTWFVHPNDWGGKTTTADFRGANLEGANLLGCQLRRANFEGAILRNAILSYTDLVGTSFIRADLSNADLSITVLSDEDGNAANFAQANLSGARFTLPGEGDEERGFLELAAADGLESAYFADTRFLSEYLFKAFIFAHELHRPEHKRFPELIRRSLATINYLQLIHTNLNDPRLHHTFTLVEQSLIRALATTPLDIYGLSSREFERLIAELLARQGWEVQLTASTRDGGYDIFGISWDSNGTPSSCIVECKRYASHRKVGVEIVRSLYGVKESLRGRVDSALLATTSGFTRGARAFRSSVYNLDLADHDLIVDWIRKVS